MKNVKYLLASTSVVALTPMLALAQLAGDGDGGDFGSLLENILRFTNTTLIPFIIGIGFLFFVWGMFQYFIAGGASEESKEKGKSLMIWATLGFVIIIVFWGIINLLASSTGLEGKEIKDIPKVEINNN